MKKKVTIFGWCFKDDFDYFDEYTKEKLNSPKKDTQKYVLKDHMVMCRYLSIINRILNTNFKINFP